MRNLLVSYFKKKPHCGNFPLQENVKIHTLNKRPSIRTPIQQTAHRTINMTMAGRRQ